MKIRARSDIFSIVAMRSNSPRIVPRSATLHENWACWVWRKANSLPTAPTNRSLSKERPKDPPPPSAGGAPPSTSGTQNLVSTEGEGDVDKTEIITSDSSDNEAYGGYQAQLLDGSVSITL